MKISLILLPLTAFQLTDKYTISCTQNCYYLSWLQHSLELPIDALYRLL